MQKAKRQLYELSADPEKTERELEESSEDFQARHWAQWRELGEKLYPFFLAEARREGREQARNPGYPEDLALSLLVRLFERRLGRTLEESEDAILRERFITLGPLRLVDLGLDLSSKQLRWWLTDPEAEYTLVPSDEELERNG